MNARETNEFWSKEEKISLEECLTLLILILRAPNDKDVVRGLFTVALFSAIVLQWMKFYLT